MKSNFKLAVMAVVALALGVGIYLCVLKVGDLNGQADLLEYCQEKLPATDGCPDAAEFAKISSLRNTARTLGYLGWFFVFALIFSVWDKIAALWNRITD